MDKRRDCSPPLISQLFAGLTKVALVAFLKDKTGGSRPARRHTFVRQQKYAKVPSPCGGHLLCLISEGSKHDTAQEAGPLPGGLPCSVIYKGKAKSITIVAALPIGEALKSLGLCGGSADY